MTEAQDIVGAGLDYVGTSGLEGRKVADFQAALARLDGSRELLIDMILFFREDVPPLLETIENSAAAGESEEAKRAAHSIKGLASSFEAERVIDHALRIERLAERGQLDEIPRVLTNLRTAISELMQVLAKFENG